jgi:hypothetical protein
MVIKGDSFQGWEIGNYGNITAKPPQREASQFKGH